MPLTIEDESTAQLVAELADYKNVSEQQAVKDAVMAELDRIQSELSLHTRLERWRAANPLPPPTGLPADKAFFDDLSGEP